MGSITYTYTYTYIYIYIYIYTEKITSWAFVQGGLKKKEMQLNVGKIFFILIFNELY